MSWFCLPRLRRVTPIHRDDELDEKPRIIKIQASHSEHHTHTQVFAGEYASIRKDSTITEKEIQISIPADEEDSDEDHFRRVVKRVHYRRGVHWKESVKPFWPKRTKKDKSVGQKDPPSLVPSKPYNAAMEEAHMAWERQQKEVKRNEPQAT